MASPIAIGIKPNANTDTILYECPAFAAYAIVAVKVLNSHTANSGAFHIAISDTATTANPQPATDQYIEYNTTLSPKANMERSSIILKPGEKIVAFNTTPDIVYRVHGLTRVSQLQAAAQGSASPSPNSWTTIYTLPSNVLTSTVNYATVHANVVNLNNSPGDVEMAISTTTPPGTEKLIEKGETLQAQGGGLIHTCMIMKPGESLLVRTTVGQMACRVSGIIDLSP